MSELPTDLPTNNLDWATDGAATLTEPTSGQKADGWALNDEPPFDEVNWRWNRVYQVFDYVLGAIIRIFEGLPEAIAATTEGELFQIRGDNTHFGQAAIEKTSKAGTGTAIELIATDGEYLYYTQGGLLVCALANPSGGVEEQWNVDISGMGTLRAIAADGQAVAIIATTSGETLKVVSKAGAVLFTSSANTDYNAVAIDSRDYIYVYLTRTTTGTIDDSIYVWDSNTATISTFVTISSGSSSGAVLTTPDFVACGYAASTHFYTKSATLIGTVGVTSASKIRTDGRRFFVASGTSVICFGLGNAAFWTATIAESAAGPVAVDGRYVYVTTASYLYAIDKMAGAIAYRWNHSAGADPTTLACDGRYLWTNVRIGSASPNYLTALSTQRNGGLWRRCGDGSTESSQGKPMPMNTLATPLDYL